ncbi:hypothetical protein AZA_56424 [Nitrospirillum viridazoti Y2]|uniref:Beta-barrel assembly machine subunit BamE n=1 Tax=Nitrospirillum amazonense TaxID=28077 RepID=A0A560IPX4_9PROT|nr:hypothetical protein [Nitrospirillum amazonense]EGX99985.1 hypothetical protein AZA_56424 [Nitrospirillum amazonense Y2]TWB58700.1 hypothetical protein FBZ92_109193 [Nitrospirillum amazonense]
MRKVLGVLAMLTVAGCVSSGTKVTADQMATLEKGKSTYTEVVSRLGQPTAVSTMANGGKVAVYSFTTASADAASYIPVVGLFAGGATAHGSTVTMTFNAAGVLADYQTTETNVKTHTGL